MVGPKASWAPGKSRMTARAMMWAQLCRSTSRASGSLSVRIWKVTSAGSAGSSRSRSTIVAVDLGGDGGLGEALADALGHVARPGAGRRPGGRSRRAV